MKNWKYFSGRKPLLIVLVFFCLLATACEKLNKLLDDAPTTGIVLNKSETTILVGGTEQLAATVLPQDASDVTVFWSSSNSASASVNNRGLVTGVSAGTADITVITNDGGYEALCRVTVSDAAVAVTGIFLNKENTTIPLGGTEQLTATITPANATNQNLTWSSNAPAIASVSDGGLVSGAGLGTAIITVTTADGSYNAECLVTCFNPPSLSTTPISNIHATYASGGGDFTSNGSLAIIEKGVCWSSINGPTILDAKTIDGTGTDSFSSSLTGLTVGTVYFVRAYATTDAGTTYGNEIQFQPVYAVGDFYAGGYIFTISGTYPNQHGKVATKHDSVETKYIYWSVTQTGTGATSAVDGPGNTSTIYSNQGAGSYAAQYCEEYTGGGYTDWYLPAYDELLLLWNNRDGIIASNGYWWSSTEVSVNNAYLVYWPSGTQSSLTKLTNAWVCPIREF